jgi:hypothetical protein
MVSVSLLGLQAFTHDSQKFVCPFPRIIESSLSDCNHIEFVCKVGGKMGVRRWGEERTLFQESFYKIICIYNPPKKYRNPCIDGV